MAELTVLEPQPPSALGRLLDDYLAGRRADGVSRKTLANYDLALRRVLVPWMGRQGIAGVDQLTNRDLNRLSVELLDQGGARGRLSRASAWTYMRNIKLFLEWAKREGEAVAAEARLPKLPRPLVEILDREEIQRIEDAARAERDKLIVRVLADTGIRVGELVRLRQQDVMEQNRRPYLRVQGKGARERLVGLHPALARRLRRHIDRERPEDADSDRLFVGRRRDLRTGRYEPLTENGVQQVIRELGHRAAITKRVHPHVFRHSAATFMLRQGMNPLLVAKVLGHESLAMITRTYSHLTVDDAHEALMAALRAD
jgi:site-specific recombinase XerD